MKQLTQAVFEGAPEWVKSFAVDSDGEGWWYSVKNTDLMRDDKYWGYKHEKSIDVELVHKNFDATDWQNSAIDREFN